MPLHLQETGVAIAYSTVGVGDVDTEKKNAVSAVSAFRETASEKAAAALLRDPEHLFLLGQADTAMLVETADFRQIFALRYPQGNSSAVAVNWVFSVPYVVPALRPDERVAEKDLLRFILHLRLRRQIYAYEDAEEKVVERLAQLLDVHRKGSRIHAGLGWSDLIVDGSFSRETFDDLVRFIIGIHSIQFRIGNYHLPVLQRMLTVIGYSMDGEPPLFPDSSHVTFLRGVPGRYDDVETLLKGYGDARILDGKADFLVLPGDTPPPPDWLRRQRELGQKEHRPDLKKVETHLMFRHASEYRNALADDRLYIDIDTELRHREDCGCRDHCETWTSLIAGTMKDIDARGLLPQEERYAVDNVLFLLGTTMRDDSNCCDTAEAIAACCHGLLVILLAIDELNEKLPDRLVALTTVNEQLLARREYWRDLVALWRTLDEWHRLTDLLLRQRTVGSYEEILGQSDRAVVYSGGVQQFLYIADALINEFARRVSRSKRLPPFTTIYDSVKTILSHRSGLVRIPTRNVFTLPLAVSDLWHEVGSSLFFLRFGDAVAKRLPPAIREEFLAHLADHYGDLIVYLHGFGGNFGKFLASLVHNWYSTYGEKHDAHDITVRQLLVRIYLVYEFHSLRAARAMRDKNPDRLRQFALEPEATATDLIDELKTTFREELGGRYRKLVVDDELWTCLWENVTAVTFSDFQRALYAPHVQEEVTTVEVNLTPFEKGRVTTLASAADLNGYFSQLASYIQDPAPAKDISYFRMMASLGKSAAIEYHRRHISS
jgi:hypothetical protein